MMHALAVGALLTLAAARPPILLDIEAKQRVLAAEAPDLSPQALRRALVAARAAHRRGYGLQKPFLTVIDYARPASERRLWVFDLVADQLVFRELVAHGRGTGDEHAVRFSNRPNTHMSSLGLYLTKDTYRGQRGYSLRLSGMDRGFNHLAAQRAIVMHGAPYVSAAHRARNGGRIGQSHGCPALDEAVARDVIDLIRRGSLVFVHYPDPEYLARSRWLQAERARARPAAYSRRKAGRRVRGG